MFYETERIVRKQQAYVKTKAYEIINDFKKAGLSTDEILACIDLTLINTVEDSVYVEFLLMAKNLTHLEGVRDDKDFGKQEQGI